MTKPADGGIAAFKVAAQKKFPEFMKLVDKLSFKRIRPEEVIDFLVEGKKELPKKRVNSENFIQISLQYLSPSGGKVVAHTGIIYSNEKGVEFSEKGAGWVYVFNDDKKKSKPVMTWLFNRNLGGDLLFRLGAYLKVAKNIVDSKPAGSFLSAHSETEFYWKGNSIFQSVIAADHLDGLNNKEVAYVKRRERVSKKYLKETEPLVLAGSMERRRTKRVKHGYKNK